MAKKKPATEQKADAVTSGNPAVDPKVATDSPLLLDAEGNLSDAAKKAFYKYIADKVKPWKWAVGSVCALLGLATVAGFITSINNAHTQGVELVANKYKDKQDELTKKQEDYNQRHLSATTTMAEETGKLKQVVTDSDLKLKDLKIKLGELDKEARVVFDNLPDDKKKAIKDVLLPSIKPLIDAELLKLNERLATSDSVFTPYGKNISGVYYQYDTNTKGEQNGTDIYILHIGRVVLKIQSLPEPTEPSIEIGLQISKNEFAFKRDKRSFPDFGMESMIASEINGKTTLYYAPRMYLQDLDGRQAVSVPGAAIYVPRNPDFSPRRVWPVDKWKPPEIK